MLAVLICYPHCFLTFGAIHAVHNDVPYIVDFALMFEKCARSSLIKCHISCVLFMTTFGGRNSEFVAVGVVCMIIPQHIS